MITISDTFLVTAHTRFVGPGSTFFAINGTKENGITYIPEAITRGATTIVIDHKETISAEVMQLMARHNVKLERASNMRQELASRSAAAYNHPAKKLRLIGITGTKGKTSTTFLLAHLARNAGIPTAMVSTVHNRILDTILPSEFTTPQADYLHPFFDACVTAGVKLVIMETAAQALSMDRVYGLEFEGVLFTNFSQEHGEFYPTMDAYFEAKKKIFTQKKAIGFELINSDDALLAATFPHADTVGTQGDYAYQIVSDTRDGITINCNNHTLACPALIGSYNAANIAMAVAAAQKLGIAWCVIEEGIKTFSGTPGRLDRYDLANGATVFIDYAHNPASFDAVLSTLKKYTHNLIVIFGAGGDRDPARRAPMGAIAARWCDRIMLTTDNPRSEDPAHIIQDILVGISDDDRAKIMIELDREKIIRHACATAAPGSIIAILGKGPDEYQIFGANKIPFSEKKIILDYVLTPTTQAPSEIHL